MHHLLLRLEIGSTYPIIICKLGYEWLFYLRWGGGHATFTLGAFEFGYLQ